MQPVLYVKRRRRDGRHDVVPLRFLVPVERAEYLARATSPL